MHQEDIDWWIEIRSLGYEESDLEHVLSLVKPMPSGEVKISTFLNMLHLPAINSMCFDFTSCACIKSLLESDSAENGEDTRKGDKMQG